jgi:hypothetical protein
MSGFRCRIPRDHLCRGLLIRHWLAELQLEELAELRIMAKAAGNLRQLPGPRFVLRFALHVFVLVVEGNEHQRVALPGPRVAPASILAAERFKVFRHRQSQRNPAARVSTLAVVLELGSTMVVKYGFRSSSTCATSSGFINRPPLLLPLRVPPRRQSPISFSSSAAQASTPYPRSASLPSRIAGKRCR